MSTVNFPCVYGICDTSVLAENLFSKNVEAVLAAGLRILQYRNKSNNAQQRLQQALTLKKLCARYSAVFIINDDVNLACELEADGVHLGIDDEKISHARKMLGKNAIIGASCHNQLALAHAAIKEGASYVAFGRFFKSKTKANARSADISILEQASMEIQAPIVGIGGITLDNADAVWHAGADTVAVCHSLFASRDPALEMKKFLEKHGETL